VFVVSIFFIIFSNVSGSMQLRGKKYILVVKRFAGVGIPLAASCYEGKVGNGIRTGVCHVIFLIDLAQSSFLFFR
jgi:hypothetical protein